MPRPPDKITLRLPADPGPLDLAWYTTTSQVAADLGYQLKSVHSGRRKENP
jgi:hypothetical protein